MANSVRTRTTLIGVAVITAALILAGVGPSRGAARVLVRETDLVSGAGRRPRRTGRRGDLPPVLASLGDDTFAQVLDTRRMVRAATPEAVGHPGHTFDSPDTVSVRTVEARHRTGIELYLAWRVLREGPNGRVEVVVGRDLESIHDILSHEPDPDDRAAGRHCRRGRGRLAAGRPGPPAGGTDPLEVAAITENRLTDRITVPESDDEVARLAVTMNELLDRIDLAYEAAAAIVGDASELQSPLTSFRAQLEIALAHPDLADWLETAVAAGRVRPDGEDRR